MKHAIYLSAIFWSTAIIAYFLSDFIIAALVGFAVTVFTMYLMAYDHAKLDRDTVVFAGCMIALAAYLLFVPSQARADETSEVSIKKWGTVDKALLTSYIALNVIDTMQTRKAISLGHQELNPVLGAKPSTEKVIALKTVVTGALYYVADENPEYRRGLLLAANAVQLFVVRHNYIECQVKFGF